MKEGIHTHTLIDRLGGYPGASWMTEHCSVWVRSWVFRTQNWHRGWMGGKKPPDLSFASLKFGGVLQVNDKLTLEPIFRQFLLIIFVTFNDIFGKLIDGVWTKDGHYCKQNWPRGLTRMYFKTGKKSYLETSVLAFKERGVVVREGWCALKKKHMKLQTYANFKYMYCIQLYITVIQWCIKCSGNIDRMPPYPW